MVCKYVYLDQEWLCFPEHDTGGISHGFKVVRQPLHDWLMSNNTHLLGTLFAPHPETSSNINFPPITACKVTLLVLSPSEV